VSGALFDGFDLAREGVEFPRKVVKLVRPGDAVRRRQGTGG
jgi:hypothetical protein